ncbi:hypothetical protein CRG98_023955 [Punica granatum]|uniref:PGG domain-containing protein n=1 Tax=Punica granatum TaxID=22663 RepID=A0A2I0JHB6_PUNGR|nr:hypothetical protein CRG98_023955 [Punica granatum]
MGTRLSEAARTGNIEYLHYLVQNDPLILETAALEVGQTPLHVAALAGQVGFAHEILKLRPELAEEMNPDGLTPLHIASAKGNLEMEVTARGETTLHLAVKSRQFEIFTLLVEELKCTNRVSILNRKDVQGNTVLHIAVSARQYEVVDFILNGKTVNKELVEVNAVNQMGLTALDALSVFTSEAGDKEIGDILILAGATSMRIATESPEDRTSDTPSNNCPRTRTGMWWQRVIYYLKCDSNKWFEYFKFKKDRDSPDDVRTALLVVAALITTATYQAVLQPPGGLWQDNLGGPVSSTTNNTTSDEIFTKPHKAGQAILGNLNPVSYILFLVFNSLGFFAAIQMIMYLTTRFPLQLELRIALYALIATYDTAMGALTPNTFFNFFFVGLSIILPILMAVLSEWLRK